MQALEPFYDKLDPAFLNVRKVVREVLQKEEDLNEIVQLVGKVGLRIVCAVAPPHAQHQPGSLAQPCAAASTCCLAAGGRHAKLHCWLWSARKVHSLRSMRPSPAGLAGGGG
jgi:hypothetical protein